MEQQEPQMQALGIFDLTKLADKDLIEKVLALSKLINIQHLPNGAIRISIDIMPKT